MKKNGESIIFVTESTTPGSTGDLDMPTDVLKNMFEITIKIK